MSWNKLRDMPMEIHITIGEGVDEHLDIIPLFGFNIAQHKQWDKDGEKWSHYQHINNINSYEQLAVILGLMPSIAQARKNGWLGYIPHGWSQFNRRLGRFYIFRHDAELVG